MAEQVKLLRDEGLTELCAAIRANKETATVAGKAVSALAESVLESLTAIDEVFADLGTSLTIANLPVTDWVENTDVESKAAGYELMYRLVVDDATIKDSVHVVIPPRCEELAMACGLCPSTDVVDGAIIFYAVEAPKVEITIHYGLIKAYESESASEGGTPPTPEIPNPGEGPDDGDEPAEQA